jgi:hypothetical protein
MAETLEDLQKQLNIFHDYCLAWKLKVNIDKTKIVCFTNGRLPQNLQFIYRISCEIVRRPVTLWFSKKSSRSFKNIANKKGDKFSPCLMPLSHGK